MNGTISNDHFNELHGIVFLAKLVFTVKLHRGFFPNPTAWQFLRSTGPGISPASTGVNPRNQWSMAHVSSLMCIYICIYIYVLYTYIYAFMHASMHTLHYITLD